MEPQFEVFGETDLLSKITINLEGIKDDPPPSPYSSAKISTLVFDGKIMSLPQEKNIDFYRVYVSYDRKKIGLLEFDNPIFMKSPSPLHHIYIYEKEDGIYINHIGYKNDLPDAYKRGVKLLSTNDFLQQNTVQYNAQQIQLKTGNSPFLPMTESELLHYFLSCFPLESAQFKELPLSDEQLAEYRKYPIDILKQTRFKPEDIIRLGFEEKTLAELGYYPDGSPIIN